MPARSPRRSPGPMQNTEPPVPSQVPDEHQNLVIRGSDASEAVAVRWDESHQELWISGASLEGEVPGARSVEGGVAIVPGEESRSRIYFDLGDGAHSFGPLGHLARWGVWRANKVSIAGGGGHDTLTCSRQQPTLCVTNSGPPAVRRSHLETRTLRWTASGRAEPERAAAPGGQGRY